MCFRNSEQGFLMVQIVNHFNINDAITVLKCFFQFRISFRCFHVTCFNKNEEKHIRNMF